ncbi:hypothetical protein [Micromonospora costi]|uniref:Uncharacterized protein n=1 Tax=Micromonospora costi TaxID=1530042 RepID=A0A3B0A6J7_9ACTN|nr:hypothetical protein [Micromonospora costi]RKN55981.1 hypothetical protein D7193_15465 [Micromonospora costi]
MASADTTPPGHLSATEVRALVHKGLRAKARARRRKTLALALWVVNILFAVVTAFAIVRWCLR